VSTKKHTQNDKGSLFESAFSIILTCVCVGELNVSMKVLTGLSNNYKFTEGCNVSIDVIYCCGYIWNVYQEYFVCQSD